VAECRTAAAHLVRAALAACVVAAAAAAEAACAAATAAARILVRSAPAVGLALTVQVPVVGAHWPAAEEVLTELRAPAYRERFDVIRVDRLPGLDRLLVVRVGPGWRRAAPATRREAAESWLVRWRHAVPQGIVAVLDAATDQSLVNFNAEGRAALTD
jgi:hypothetical protein